MLALFALFLSESPQNATYPTAMTARTKSSVDLASLMQGDEDRGGASDSDNHSEGARGSRAKPIAQAEKTPPSRHYPGLSPELAHLHRGDLEARPGRHEEADA